MHWVRSGDPDYESTREVFNRDIDRRPEVIARCGSADEVAQAVAFGQQEGLAIAVRSGGHSVAGHSTNDGGLVVDVRPMDTVEVDQARASVRVGSGATWGQIDAATQAHGLGMTGGRATTTGVAGFTLGGGDGWLARAFGLACDNLTAVELVTADGRQVRASESEHPELFWALHGGGGNFGVATSFEFRLYPLGPRVLAGLAVWPLSDRSVVTEVGRAYRDLMARAPAALGGGLIVVSDPDAEIVPAELAGESLLGVVVCYAGDPGEGREVVADLLAREPAANLVSVMPYTAFQESLTDPPGFRHYWSADYHDAFDDAAIEVFLSSGARRPTPLTQQVLFPWGGAIARVGEDATPLSRRSTPWVTHPFAIWDDPADGPACRAWVRQFRQDIAEHTNGGVYLNYIGLEGEDRVRAAYGESTYARLQAVKGEYDPGNVFRANQNIRPG